MCRRLTGSSLAPSPVPMTTAALAFSPGGRRLAAATEQHVVIVWDLARIRAELAAMDLDLELPQLPFKGE